jgi:Ser/Thr protein kinase RdoA (MazF antagonist)
MTLDHLSHEQLTILVRKAFPSANIVSSAFAPAEDSGPCYYLQLSNQMEATLQLYIGPAAAHIADKEVRLLRLVTSETGVPVPRVLHADESLPPTAEFADQAYPWALLTRLPGRPLSEVVSDLDDGQLDSLGYEVGRYLAHIHQIPLDEFGELFSPGPFDSPQEKAYVLACANHLIDECAAETLLDERTSTALRTRFAEATILVRPRACLLHGDFHLGNVIAEQGATGYHVTGILDFAHAHSGSPEYDVGKLFADRAGERPALRKGFLDGYTEMGQLLPSFWQRLALYGALVSLEALLLAQQREKPEGEQMHRDRITEYLATTTGRRSEQP